MAEYKIVIVDNKTNYIATNRKNKELLVSNDIKLSRTDNGELRATFQNQEQNKPTFSDFVRDLFGKRQETNSSDCSIIIHDTSLFHYCIREGGGYKLFGGGVTFNGTKGNDKLTMYECQNATINLGDGNDTIKIEGAKPRGFLADFQNNKINMGKGDDKITISGNFNKFTDNKINLGKGDDIVQAEINPEDDTNITSAFEYGKMENKYAQNVLGSEISATDGNKGWFEKDLFNSRTFTSNKLSILGFKEKNVTTKPAPQRPIIVPAENKTVSSPQKEAGQIIKKTTTSKPKEKITKENCETRYRASSILLNFGVKGAEEGVTKALNDYVELMAK